MRCTFYIVLTIVALTAAGRSAWAVEASSLRLVPMPREVRIDKGTFPLDGPLVFEAPAASAKLLGRMLADEFKIARLAPPKSFRRGDGAFWFRLARGVGRASRPPIDPKDLPKKLGVEGYRLVVSKRDIVCAAPEAAGLFYGLQTLRQLIRANRTADGKALPCMTIDDWPALRWRCFQDDMTRGPSSKLATMQRDVQLGAFTKMNVWTYYMEYQFAFKKHPKIGPPNGSLTPKDLKALVAFSKPLHVDVMGNQQSFGHFGRILSHPEYADLRETGSLLTPANPKSYALLDDLYSEVIPLVPFEFFNVCCDETWGLGRGPSKAMAAKIGVGGVYVSHIRKVYDLVKGKYGKRMMMWGDIILQHPKNLKDIPKDVIMLTWGYGAKASFVDQIKPFTASGYEFFVCPGVSNWSRILPDFGVATTNIRNFVRDGVANGAIGMLNTAWEDDGEALGAPKWHGHAWGGECAWTGSKTMPKDFNRRIGAVLFGEKGDHFGKAIELLAKTHRLAGTRGMNNRRFWQDDFLSAGGADNVRASANALLALVRPAIEHLLACKKEAVVNAGLLDHFLQGARRMELIASRMLDGLAVQALYAKARTADRQDAGELLDKARTLVVKNRDATEALGKEFARLWLSESKPYLLDRTLNRYAASVKAYTALAARLAKAAEALKKGQPVDDLPVAAQPRSRARGPLPKPMVRITKPTRVIATPLKGDTPWARRDASHRFVLVVSAGDVDRYDVPLEVDVSVPKGLATRPVQVFRQEANGATQEVLAQLDVVGEGEKGQVRFSAILPGKLARGTSAEMTVYLGLKDAPLEDAEAVTTKNAPDKMKWIENDKVRLLLGPAGAHVFQWQIRGVKPLEIGLDRLGGLFGHGPRIPRRAVQARMRRPRACVGALPLHRSRRHGQDDQPVVQVGLDRRPAQPGDGSLLGL